MSKTTVAVHKLSAELKGYPALAVMMTARKVAGRMGLTFDDSLTDANLAAVMSATGDDIRNTLAEARRRARGASKSRKG